MNTLSQLLDTYRNAAASEREKGTYFEELIVCYLRNEATYKDLYAKVWNYSDWALAKQGFLQILSAVKAVRVEHLPPAQDHGNCN